MEFKDWLLVIDHPSVRTQVNHRVLPVKYEGPRPKSGTLRDIRLTLFDSQSSCFICLQFGQCVNH